MNSVNDYKNKLEKVKKKFYSKPSLIVLLYFRLFKLFVLSVNINIFLLLYILFISN